mmetsp:Transcript_11446/g.32498  ORF Transcript_11446/g.32498 Transcript_11446/m.32498 type:complete len:111 (+) Transcript_11446:311-643(+)
MGRWTGFLTVPASMEQSKEVQRTWQELAGLTLRAGRFSVALCAPWTDATSQLRSNHKRPLLKSHTLSPSTATVCAPLATPSFLPLPSAVADSVWYQSQTSSLWMMDLGGE